MTATWKPHDLDPAEEFQDPMQHWLLVPSPGMALKQPLENDTVAYLFRFNTGSDFQEFQNRFTSDPAISFPPLAPLQDPETREVFVAGFSELKNLSEIFSYLSEHKLGELFLTGLPIEGFDGIEIGESHIGESASKNIVAIIDTDIAFANARFRRSVKNSRIAAYWDQNTCLDPAMGPSLGRVLNQSDIDGYLDDFEQNGNVDEAALYAQYYADTYAPNCYPRLPSRVGHGTCVLDTIDGAEFDRPDGEECEILAVDLPNGAVDATHGLFLLPWVFLGVWWILNVSGERKPQINFSFGGLAGRHDSFGPHEMLFDRVLELNCASAISVPAGNFYGTETHATLTGADLATPQTLEWNVQPNDGTPNMVEIWLPVCHVTKERIRLTLTSPEGVSTTVTDTDLGEYQQLSDGGEVLARIYVHRVSTFGAPPRIRIAIFVRHTAIHRDYFHFIGGAPNLAGAWCIGLERIEFGDDERVELWVERDDALGLAKNGARQSYFEAPHPVWPEMPPPPTFVRNDGTTSDIATGQKTLIAAGSVRTTRQPAVYSSEGFGRKNCYGEPAASVRFPPTAAAICDDSRVHTGVLASGFFSGSTVAMNGTSISSAMVARKVKGRILNGDGVTRADIEALADPVDKTMIPPTACINWLFDNYDTVPPKTRIGSGFLESPWTRLPRILL